jgi:hypothetical protein
MKTKRVLFVSAAALAGVSIAVCTLALLGSSALFSPSQASQLEPLIDPPVTFLSGTWPSYASEALTSDPYPPRAGEPVQICAILENHHATQVFTPAVEISIGYFGIGTLFAPIQVFHKAVPPSGQTLACLFWVPPYAGNFNISARLSQTGYTDQIAMRSIDAGEPLEPGTPHNRTFVVVNPTSNAVTVTLGLVPHRPGWGFELSEDFLSNLQPGAMRPVTLTVTPSSDFPTGEALVVDVEGYIGGNLLGGFRKIYSSPLTLHHPPDPVYAESEISITPYPPQAGEPTELCMDLDNRTAITQTAEVRFSVAQFGIGLPFHAIMNWQPIEISPRGEKHYCITWVPPQAGLFCAQAELALPGLPVQTSQRNLDVGEPLQPLVPHERSFTVYNNTSQAVTYTLGMIPHLPGWGLQLSQDVLPNIPPGGDRLVILTVTPPASLPPEGAPIVDIEAFHGVDLIGGFRKIYSPPVPVHQPGDPVYAESEIQVSPYPPRAGEPVRISVDLRNPTDTDLELLVQFDVAYFGIGLPFTPIDAMTVTIPAHGMVQPSTMWVPPVGGLWWFQVEVTASGHGTVYSQRNIDVGEPLLPFVPHSRQFPVYNNTSQAVTYTLALVPHLPGWGMALNPDLLVNMLPGTYRVVTLTVTPSAFLPQPGTPVVDVEAYNQGELVGGFRKLFTPPVPLHQPGDPVYAESEIGVDPYPALPGKPVRLSVRLNNPTDTGKEVSVRFEWAPFGIGLPFSNSGISPFPLPVFVPAHGAARGVVLWNPPPGFHGKFCVKVWLEIPGHEPVWSQRNIDVGEPLEPGHGHRLVFPLRATGYSEPVTLTLGLISYRPNWQMLLEPLQAVLNPGQPVEASLVVTPPLGAQLGTGDPIADVEAYVNGELLGGFRKLDVPPVPLHKPHEPGYAESEIQVYPVPPQLGHTSLVSATVQNSSEQPMTVVLEFGWAQFGMGLPFSTTGMVPITRTVTLNPEEAKVVSVQWTPQLSGHQCLRVLLHDQARRYRPQQSQRNVEVVERTICGEIQKVFTLQNPLPTPITVTIGSNAINLPPGWTFTVDPPGPFVLEPFESVPVTLTIQIPCQPFAAGQAALPDIPSLPQETGSWPAISVEAIANGEMIGGIQLQFSPQVVIPLYLPVIRR